MKARLVYINTSYHLPLCNGTIKKLSESDAQRFIETYDSELHYVGKHTWNFDDVTMHDYGGETIARVTDSGELVIESPRRFRTLLGAREIRYLTPAAYAEKVGRHRTLINQMCRDGRIPGAKKMGTRWLIPENADYPDDARRVKRI